MAKFCHFVFIFTIYFGYSQFVSCYSVVKRFPVTNLNVEDRPEEVPHYPEVPKPEDAFHGIYSECVLYLSYACIQKRTLKYLNSLNKQDEIPVLGKYLMFGKKKNLFYDTYFHNFTLWLYLLCRHFYFQG